ncbi:hypothetical protein GE21DRAFT_9855 [Neurospora crassa]|uniref:Endosome-associated ubiquitin isopeptidase n=1 Tax=Neurospora crassa (strain ATCC 24698 / 74-OR23-1A / CBS 708.71 / DSM 1257 / FGSC 987) TaxID=367110 RepID=Q7S0H7_NEUCR|nr:endosome-associated ubiquitin isopeptidase [Neurospora crassa OR74A]EAA28809.3 endosome-associated ubiquitin isopeptidase [Neurospora crassa OR74A]KHE88067.1 hypothetical protein GE21DRAFT_9855 [Neurospora crassa]|eukprot:XP_958045.3 endosome-associated ubiquitin isopeptidase [Neurospora crassa OR74A]
MGSATIEAGSRPMNVREISEKAKQYDWNPRIGFKFWARAANTIHHEGQIYLQEGSIAQAYMFLLRYCTLVLEDMAKHPEAKLPENRSLMKQLNARINTVVEQLEQLKPQIEEAYAKWQQLTASVQDSREKRLSTSSQYSRHAANDAALSWNHLSQAKILDAGSNQELAVDLAREALLKRRRRRRQESADEDERMHRPPSGYREERGYDAGRRQQYPTPPLTHHRYSEDDDLRRQMEATRRQLDRSGGYGVSETDNGTSDTDSYQSVNYHYPAIKPTSTYTYDYPKPASRPESPKPQPPLPPKVIPFERPVPVTRPPPPPPRPRKGSGSLNRDSRRNVMLPSQTIRLVTDEDDVDDKPARPPKVSEPLPPPPETQPKEANKVTFRPVAYLESGEPLRSVFLPSGLRRRFLELARGNTIRELEMCGILCGTLINNALFITCLLIPEQECTSDTCETINEEAYVTYCIENDLLVLGWIHTHPTQTCFMSSRDLHTHAGYQTMMKESIAIVCAPRYDPSYGIFRLTDPPGLPHIINCNTPGVFHQHAIPSDEIYCSARHAPGHVFESSRVDFEVVDLRPEGSKVPPFKRY